MSHARTIPPAAAPRRCSASSCSPLRPSPGRPERTSRRQVPAAQLRAADAERVPNRVRCPRPPVLAAARRLRDRGRARRREPAHHRHGDRHLSQRLPRRAHLYLAAARAEHAGEGQRHLQDRDEPNLAAGHGLPRHQAAPQRLRRRFQARVGDRHRRHRPADLRQQDDDAHRPPPPAAEGRELRLQREVWYNINDRMEIGGRSGYEYFEEDENYLYTIAQFFPAWPSTTRSRLAEQAVPRLGRVHAALRRLPREHHRLRPTTSSPPRASSRTRKTS